MVSGYRVYRILGGLILGNNLRHNRVVVRFGDLVVYDSLAGRVLLCGHLHYFPELLDASVAKEVAMKQTQKRDRVIFQVRLSWFEVGLFLFALVLLLALFGGR